MKTKIVFLIGSFETGGKERQLAEIIKNLPKDKFEVHLFAKVLKAHYLTEEDIKQHLSSVCTLNQKSFRLSDIFRLVKYLNKVRPDAVFSFSSILSHFCLVAKFFTSASFQLINGSIRDAPRIFKFVPMVERLLYPLYKYVVANSYSGLEVYRQKGKKGRFVLYNGFRKSRIPDFSCQEARERLKLPTDSFVVTMIAAISGRKDHKTFLKAAGECVRNDGNICFLLAGDGHDRKELEAFSQQLQVNEVVRFLGERSDVEALILASDLTALTSSTWHGEGISNSILESLACGVPVVATDNGGTKEIVLDGVNGFVIEVGDYKTLSEKILYLKNEPETLKKFSLNAEKIVREKFSVETMIKNFIQIIDEVLTSRP